MAGYAGRPDATREALRAGWLHTGDVGHLDDEGYRHVTDRLTDVIVSGGENVYSPVVEQVLCAHPAVAEAAVVGVPDSRWGRGGGRLLPRAARRGRPSALAGVPFRTATDQHGQGAQAALREPFCAGHDRRVAGV
jgi:hypothetical protein